MTSRIKIIKILLLGVNILYFSRQVFEKRNVMEKKIINPNRHNAFCESIQVQRVRDVIMRPLERHISLLLVYKIYICVVNR